MWWGLKNEAKVKQFQRIWILKVGRKTFLRVRYWLLKWPVCPYQNTWYPTFFAMVFAFFSERVNNNNLFTPNGQRRKEKKLWANVAHSVILIVIYLKDRSYNLALVSQVRYHTLRRNHLGISYQSFPHSLHRHSKTLLNSKGHSVSGSRIIKSLWQEDQCNTKEGLNKLKQCCWRRFFFGGGDQKTSYPDARRNNNNAKLYNTWRAWYASFRTLRRRVGKCSHRARKEKPKVIILFWCPCESRCL